jgi:hypothetical protein
MDHSLRSLAVLLPLLAFLESDGVPTDPADFWIGGCLLFGFIGFCLLFLWLGWWWAGRR